MSFKSFMAKSKYLATGLIIGSLLTSGIVYAAGSDYVLSLFQAKLIFNGADKQGSEKPFMYYNGQQYVPTSLIYNGTTYVPLRFFSESLGQPVKYVSENETIYVGKVPDDGRIERNMSDILKPYYTEKGYFRTNSDMTIAGKKYSKGYEFSENKISFNLEGKYVNISTLIGLLDGNNNYGASLEVYGDDKLITTIEIEKGSLPQNVNIDVKGVIKLDINCKASIYTNVGMANITIK